MKSKLLKPPTHIGSTEVIVASREPMEVKGGLWVTLVPTEFDEDDDRLWEFDIRSGRLLKMR